ncbi:C3 and PZP-like alpha-2-macroglobulin domain-containing protein 8 [Diadema setosum]|uniref:C3 and PZP-like alpha-2-macroglobulin domain-containing protein 8 n=1 Tax=Diadema setosum TaxID=31175 RepID=UPI003B3A98F1
MTVISCGTHTLPSGETVAMVPRLMSDEEIAMMGNHPMLNGKKRYICSIPACPVIHTGDGGSVTRRFAFLDFELSGNPLVVDFEVSANQDAQIALSRENTSLADMYRIVLGGSTNTMAIVQRDCATEHSIAGGCRTVSTSHDSDTVLSLIPTYDRFWLTFGEGRFRIGRHGNQVSFIDWTDPNPLPVNHIGVWTGWGSEGYWKFHSFC